jgi:hypothetical protein
MKIVFFATYYHPYLNHFEKSHNIENLSYTEIYNLLLGDFFGIFGLYAINSNNLGHEAQVIIANFKPLQIQWAKENSFHYDNNNWQYSIAAEQVKKIKPDVFFIGSMFEFYGHFIDEIKPFCKIITAWTACPIPPNINHQQFKLVLTSVPELRDKFRNNDKTDSEILLPGFDPAIFEKLKFQISKNIDFSFVGGISPAHSKRIEDLKYLSKKTNLKLFGYGYPQKRKYEFLKQYIKPHFYFKNYKGEAWGMDMYLRLGNSKITFNSHIDMANDNAVNMRMFEATGMGALLLTDYKSNLNSVFEIDKEIVTYKTIEEAVEKVNYYMEHRFERETIAKAGQARTFEQYNFKTVTERMLQYFEIAIKKMTR